MVRTALYVFGGILLGLAIHLIVILTLPQLAEHTVAERLDNLGQLDKIVLLAPVKPGEPNPLRMPVRETTPRSALLPSPFRARRVCCVRYEIPGETQLCASCPLLLTMPDEALALQEAIR